MSNKTANISTEIQLLRARISSLHRYYAVSFSGENCLIAYLSEIQMILMYNLHLHITGAAVMSAAGLVKRQINA